MKLFNLFFSQITLKVIFLEQTYIISLKQIWIKILSLQFPLNTTAIPSSFDLQPPVATAMGGGLQESIKAGSLNFTGTVEEEFLNSLFKTQCLSDQIVEDKVQRVNEAAAQEVECLQTAQKYPDFWAALLRKHGDEDRNAVNKSNFLPTPQKQISKSQKGTPKVSFSSSEMQHFS